MKFIAAKCPSCSGSLQIPDDRDVINCMYCSSSIIVREVLKTQVVANIENLMVVAGTALQSGNVEEANKYYTQVLEHEIRSSDAWFGKGVVAGLSAARTNVYTADLNKTDLKIKEMISCFAKAIEYAPADRKDELSLAASAKSIEFSTTLMAGADELLRVLDFQNRARNKARSHLLCQQLLPALDTANAWVVGNPRAPYSAKNRARQKLEAVHKAIGQSKGGCFIATAALGTSLHPAVFLLQDFREVYLRSTWKGRLIIRVYNTIAPGCAAVIRRSSLLRLLVLKAIVIPASDYAQRRLRRNKALNGSETYVTHRPAEPGGETPRCE